MTQSAIEQRGIFGALSTFIDDLGDPWRRQFYIDLEIHLLLVACWMIYREPSKMIGLACGLATIVLGALVTAPYLLITTFRTKGDLVALLIGSHRVDRAGAAPPQSH
ncbi:hypothetical protein [Sphingomonas sp.]|uniref:hypothetical protein n=1 Tax=Sphingomonas sp. TaxID=28214 RepID=UPI002EDB4617